MGVPPFQLRHKPAMVLNKVVGLQLRHPLLSVWRKADFLTV